jgi:hypothetical protein
MARPLLHRWWFPPIVIACGGILGAVAVAEVARIDRLDEPATALQPAERGLVHISASSLGTCTAAVHDRFVAVGPDGRTYRTWHPQTVPVDPAAPAGATCTFGHEHGDNPATSLADPTPPLFGYAAMAGHMVEPHEGFKVFVINAGTTNDEGRTALNSTRVLVHMGTGGAARFSVREHTFEFDLVAADGHEVHVQGMADTGLAGSICQRDSSLNDGIPDNDVGRTVVVTPGNGCDTFGSLYEIWTLQLDVGAAHVIASTAVFDPITVMNPADRTAAIRTETVYPGFGVQHGCNRESYHGPVYWYNASGPTRFFTDAHGNRVPEGTPMALEQYVSRHSAIGIPMNQDQSLMKLHRPTCAPGLAAAN